MQKHGLTPDQKLRKAMYDPLIECKPDDKTVSVLGSDFALDESSDIKTFIKRNIIIEYLSCQNVKIGRI